MFTDPSSMELLQCLAESQGRCLWLAEENQLALLSQLMPYASKLDLLSNRWDIADRAQKIGLQGIFNDWQFTPAKQEPLTEIFGKWQASMYDQVFLRICKEKPVNHHLLHQAYLQLNVDGTLTLAGEKSEGIKSYWQSAAELFGDDQRLQKIGNCYRAQFIKKAAKLTTIPEPSESYRKIQVIGQWDNQPIYSKPGVYGWNKIDHGSRLLLDQLNTLTSHHSGKVSSILDLGCGYGLLTLATSRFSCERRVATDNNAAALICTQLNATVRNLEVEVVAGDCGNTVSGKFDLVLCNPPFHRGFDVDRDLTSYFLGAARAKLNPGGAALFVVNSFIPIERKLEGLFRETATLKNDNQFKVLLLRP